VGLAHLVCTNCAPVQTPLPPAMALFASGLGMMGLLGWRRKRKVATAV
jgi:PEP-CTERM motif